MWEALGIAVLQLLMAVSVTVPGYLSPPAPKALPVARACSFSSLDLNGPLSSLGLSSPSSLDFCHPPCSVSDHSLKLSSGFPPSDQTLATLSHLHLSPLTAQPTDLFLCGKQVAALLLLQFELSCSSSGATAAFAITDAL